MNSTHFAGVLDDLRYGSRALGKQPRFVALVVATLALGIGACTLVFSVVNAVLLDPLPYAESDRLVQLWSVHAANPIEQRVSYPDFVDWRGASRSLDLAGYGSLETVLTGAGDPERLSAELLVGDLFGLLGVAPLLGSLSPEAARDGQPVVVLSHGLWRRRFDADPDIVGSPVTLGGTVHTVVAVMPAGFEFPLRATSPAELWIPLARFNPALAEQRGARLIEVIGRLRSGATLETAAAELSVIAADLGARYPASNAGFGVRLTRVRDEVVADVSRGISLLGAAVGALLLIGCVNVANLILARTASRAQETAVRAALGGDRARIFRQLMIESLLLSLAGGGLGCLLAFQGVETLAVLLGESVPRGTEIALSGPVLAFAVVLSLATGLVFGLVPAWSASGADLVRPLQRGAGSVSRDVSRRRLTDVLVVGEVGMAVILLSAAGLFIASFWKLDRAAPGFDPRDVLSFEVSWPATKYPDPARAFDELRAGLLAIPGVVEASTGLQLPDRGRAMLDDTAPFVRIEGLPAPPVARQRASTLTIQPGYFRALGIPLVAGRDLDQRDRAEQPRVAIVNEALVRAYLGGADPVGRRLSLDSWVLRGESGAEIVGVVGDVTHRGLQAEAQPIVYLPLAQWPTWDSPMVVRTTGDPLRFVPAILAAVRAIDPEQPIDDIELLERRIAGTLSGDRSRALLLGGFAAIALTLAAVGLFGVLSYTTSQRAREIAIRVSLGASSGDVLRSVIGHGMKRVLVGALIGLAVAVALARVVGSLLFEVSPTDPAALAAATALLLVVTLPACVMPARRAARTDPATVIKCG